MALLAPQFQLVLLEQVERRLPIERTIFTLLLAILTNLIQAIITHILLAMLHTLTLEIMITTITLQSIQIDMVTK